MSEDSDQKLEAFSGGFDSFLPSAGLALQRGGKWDKPTGEHYQGAFKFGLGLTNTITENHLLILIWAHKGGDIFLME